MSIKITRRHLFPLAGAGLIAGVAGLEFLQPRAHATFGRSRVGVYKIPSYNADLTNRIFEGAQACGLDVKGQRVFIDAHLEAFNTTHSANADSSLVAATVQALRRMGAAEVSVGAGPSWERDTTALAEAARYRDALPDFEKIFVDLNRDDVSPVEGVLKEILYLPNTALRADLVVSLAKMKTDARTGVAMSVQNLSGLVPGSVYGWPKDGAFGRGEARQDRFIVDLARVFHRGFAIVDGIVGMEGNGPIDGTPKSAGVLVMGEDLAATDATCCRIMGIDPGRVDHLIQCAATLSNIDPVRIDYQGERPESVRTDFLLPVQQGHLRLA